MRFYVIANADGDVVSVGSVVASADELSSQGLRVVGEFDVETDDTKIAMNNLQKLVDTAAARLAAIERRVTALENKPGGTP